MQSTLLKTLPMQPTLLKTLPVQSDRQHRDLPSIRSEARIQPHEAHNHEVPQVTSPQQYNAIQSYPTTHQTGGNKPGYKCRRNTAKRWGDNLTPAKGSPHATGNLVSDLHAHGHTNPISTFFIERKADREREKERERKRGREAVTSELSGRVGGMERGRLQANSWDGRWEWWVAD